MKVEIRIDPEEKEPRVILAAPCRTAAVEELARRLEAEWARRSIPALRGGETVLLPTGEILNIYTDGKGVSCRTAEGEYALRRRLYELEEEFAGTRLVRVSNSEMVNLDKVTGLDLSLVGTIRMTLEGGATVYASRRYVKKIKQALGL